MFDVTRTSSFSPAGSGLACDSDSLVVTGERRPVRPPFLRPVVVSAVTLSLTKGAYAG